MSARLSKDVLRAAFAMPVVASGKWNLLFPRGTFHGPNLKQLGGSLTIDDAFLSECVASWVAQGKPQLAVVKTHQHLDEEPTPTERLVLEEAYGFITDMRASDAGLECFVEWNPAGVEAVTSGKWGFWSAEWGRGTTNLLTGQKEGWNVWGAALTNKPFLSVLPPLAASANAVIEGKPNSKSKEKMTMEELLKQCAEMLSGENGAAFGAALNTLITKSVGDNDGDEGLTAAPPTPPAPGPADMPAAALAAAVKPLEEKLKAAQSRIDALTASALDAQVDAEALKLKAGDGKFARVVSDELIAAAKREARASGVKSAVALMASLAPQGAPLKAAGLSGEDKLAGTPKEASEKLAKRASELRASGTKDAMLVAMREDPEAAVLASRFNPDSKEK